MSDQFVSVRGLVYEYGVNRALDEVSFDLPAGSVTALVGPNGAGKTTLLRCLAGLERPLAGSVRIDGIDVLEQPRLAHAKLGFQQDFFWRLRRSVGTAQSAACRRHSGHG